MTTVAFQHVSPAFRTYYGPDALAALPRELDRHRASRAVVVCGESIAHRHGDALDSVTSALGGRLAGRFERVREHSPIPVVEALRDELAKLRADAVIAVGGGSAIVTARAATILLAEGRDVRELCTRGEDGRLVSPRLSAPKLPQWIVPSTPSTASAKAGSAVRDPETGQRLALFDPKTRAQGIFVDPQMASTAPVSLTRGSALNAFSMAVEGLQSDTLDPRAEALLLHALRMVVRWLPRLARAGDPEPSMRLMVAALLCGQGSDHTGGGLAQALSHAAGPRSSVANGVVEALLLPHVVRYNAPVTAERLAGLAETVGHASSAANESPGVAAVALVEHVLGAADVPVRLRDVGIPRDALPEIVDHALEDWSLTRIPRPAGRAELEALLEEAW
jgi:alcohol dehydrogenase class IV